MKQMERRPGARGCLAWSRLCLPIMFALTVPARAQTDAQSLGAGLSEVLSLATFGVVSTDGQAARVIREGDDYRVTLPMKGITESDDRSIVVVGTQSSGGAWDIKSITFPSTTTYPPRIAGAPPTIVTIGRQDIHGHIDPSFASPSHYVAALENVTTTSGTATEHMRQSVRDYAVTGDLLPAPGGLLTFTSNGGAHDWHMGVDAGAKGGFDISARELTMNAALDGLDRNKATLLTQRLRSLMAQAKAQSGEAASAIDNDAARRSVRAILDDAVGVLTSINGHETLHDVQVDTAAGLAGGAKRLALTMSGEAAGQVVNVMMDMELDELSILAVPAPYAPYVPRHAALRYQIKGAPSRQIVDLMRAGLEPNADPTLLGAQAMKLLANPDTNMGIDPFSFDTGPMNVNGTARLFTLPSGQFGGHVHISATGVDALTAQIQSQPEMQQALPMLLLAKGLGKPDGKGLTWDIDFGDGPPKVNGIPLGQLAAPKR